MEGPDPEKIARAIKESEDPQHELESAVFDFIHDVEPEARQELSGRLNAILEAAKQTRNEPGKSRLVLDNGVFTLMERFKDPKYLGYINRIRRAVRHMIVMGEEEKKIRESR